MQCGHFLTKRVCVYIQFTILNNSSTYSIHFCVGNYILNKIEDWLKLNDIPERRSLSNVQAVRSAQFFSDAGKSNGHVHVCL